MSYQQPDVATNSDTPQRGYQKDQDAKHTPAQQRHIEDLQGQRSDRPREADCTVHTVTPDSTPDTPEMDTEGEQMCEELTGEFLNFSLGNEGPLSF